MFNFDGVQKIVVLSSGTTAFDAQDLYSDWKTWVLSGNNSVYLPAFSTIGGESISASKSVAPYFFLTNGWRIRPYEGNHQLEVDGNLFVEGGAGNPFIITTGSYNVFINISTSSDSTVTEVSTSSIDNNTLNRIEKKVDDVTALSL